MAEFRGEDDTPPVYVFDIIPVILRGDQSVSAAMTGMNFHLQSHPHAVTHHVTSSVKLNSPEESVHLQM